MKDIRGWLAFAIFCAACVVIGMNRLLMRSLNPTLLVMVAIAIVIVLILRSPKDPKDPNKDVPDEGPDGK